MDNPPSEGAPLPRIPKKKRFAAPETEVSADQRTSRASTVGGDGGKEGREGEIKAGRDGAPQKGGEPPKKKAAARSSSSEKYDPPILRKGDLVRLSNEQKSGRIQGGLARVTRANFAPDDEEPVSYDIEYVLGGKLNNLERCELEHTTAAAEGLVDTNLRRRRATATSETQKEQEAELAKKKPSKSGGSKAVSTPPSSPTKRGPGRPPGSKNKSTLQREATKAAKKKRRPREGDKSDASAASSAAKKRRGSKSSDAESAAEVRSQAAKIGWERRREQEAAAKKAGVTDKPAGKAPKPAGKGSSKRKSATTDASESDVTSAAEGESARDRKSKRKDMYVKHRNELERSLGRLEKVDRFGFFLDATPPEFDEEYDDEDEEMDHADEGEATEHVRKNKKAVQFPDQPPFNFHVVRKRFAAGRYDLDMVALEQKRLREIKAMIGAAASSGGEANEEAKEVEEVIVYDELAKSMTHPVAVDWETFNADILAMCDAAKERDPDGAELGSGHLGWAALKVQNLMEEMYGIYGAKRRLEVDESEAKAKYEKVLAGCGNMEAAMQGKWRKEAFPERKYERLECTSVICDGLSPKDRSYAMYELETKLPDSFVGLAYTYDDSGQHSETWMKTVADETTKRPKKKKKNEGEDSTETSSLTSKTETKAQRAALALARDDGVVRAQVQTTMTTLLIQVQDRVMTDLGVMHRPEARSANWDDGDRARDYRGDSAAEVAQGTHSGFSLPEVAEQEVWGIDCYTRKNVMTLIQSEFNEEIATEFVQKWLLPAINACPVDLAHKMSTASRLLEGLPLVEPGSDDRKKAPSSNGVTSGTEESDVKSMEGEGANPLSNPQAEASGTKSLQESSVFLRTALESKIKEHGPPWLKAAARLIRLASDSMDDDHFRIHPKGHGSVVIGEEGLKANSLVTYYRGEVYPAWRWCEKLDAIEHVQRELDLRPNLPDFYNMAMERPKKDPRGYSLLFVDASRKSGLGSSFSHSCNPTCEVRVVSLNGKLSLSMTTLRDLEQGEELTFDYNAVTESLNEYRFAVCLCGQLRCRGSFLHFATADCYQQVLSRNSPLSARFANLVRGCMKKVMSKEDTELLLKHGFNTAAFGAVSFNHHVSNVDPSSTPDSIENVPIWLRTFVADCLRYIEYERRALPVALLCNQMERMEKKQGKKKKAPKRQKVEPVIEAPSDKSKAIAGSKPQTSYFFFLQSQRDRFEKMVKKESGPQPKGLELSQAINKQASQAWSNLSEEEKQKWKKKAIADWKKKGGKEKAKLEEERLRALKNAPKMPVKVPDNQAADDTASEHSKSTDSITDIETKTISFADADAEGFSAMEQRVQQLAQSLSRVGRVLDRHRESVFAETTIPQIPGATVDSDFLRSLVPSPLKIMSDEEVVNWMWSDPKGIVESLFAMVEKHFPENSLLMKLLSSTKQGYPVLTAFSQNYSTPGTSEKKWKHSCTGSDARRLAREALLKFRTNLVEFLTLAERSHTEARNEKRREQARAREEKKKQKAKSSGATTYDGDVVDDESMADQQHSSLPYEQHESSLEHVPSSGEQAVLMRGGGDESVSTDPPIVDSQAEALTGASAKVESDTLLPPTKEPKDSQQEATKMAESTVNEDAKSLLPPTTDAKDSLHEDVKSLLQFSQIASSFRAIPEAQASGHVSADSIQSRPTLSIDTSETQATEANQSPSKLQELIDAASGNEQGVGLSAPPAPPSTGPQGPLSPPPAPLSTGSQDPASAGSDTKKPKKKVVPLSEEQVKYLTDWMFDPRHILNPYPTDEEKAVMMKDLGIERPRLDGWFMKNRKRVLYPDIEPVNMKWRKRDQEHWIEFRKSRYMLEATADLLLMYANTNTFFMLEPFREFATTEVEVYARELGNEVPRHFALNSQKSASPAPAAVDSDGDVVMDKAKASAKKTTDEGARDLCSPDDVIDKVTVDYSGEYVLSQLLQWVNGGIGQRKGLPDIYGCVMLPPIEGCWEEVKCSEVKLPNYTKWNRKTTTEYDGNARPKLAEWIADRYQRGSPWDEEVKKYLCPQDQVAPDPTLPMGSPVIDYLVTGFDDNLRRVASALQSGRADESSGGRKKMSAKDRLQSTVDEGMPAQAVANWVQCENPKCLKWRKLPWHVDVDLLPEKFYCKDNIWNPKSQFCEAEEDEWDMDDAPIKFDTNVEQFEVGAWFDVQREGKVGYHEAQVVELDFESNVKQVKFHFHRLSSDRDEWVEVGSPRIAPHHAYTPRPLEGYVDPKKKSDKSKGSTSTPSNAAAALPRKRKIDTLESSTPSEAGGTSGGHKKAIPFPQATIEYLNAWMKQHAHNPFPDATQKAKIIADTGLSKRQLSDWMARARKKMKQKSDKPSSDLQTMSSISSSPTKVENLLLELRNQPPKGSTGLVASAAIPPAPLIEAEKPKVSIKELETYLKTWLAKPENQCDMAPTAVQKEKIMRETGIEKKRLEGWFFRARKRMQKQKEAERNNSFSVSQPSCAGMPVNASHSAATSRSGTFSAVQHLSSSKTNSLSGPPGGVSISPMIAKKASAPVPSTNAAASKSSAPQMIKPAAASQNSMTFAGIAKPVPASSSGSSGKQSIGLTEEAKRHLSRWLSEHKQNPYPTRDEKDKMMKLLGITDERKLEGWFCRERKKLKEKESKPKSSGLPDANRKDPTNSHAIKNRPTEHTLHPGQGATGQSAASGTEQSSAPAQSSASAQAAASPFASLMSAVTSELTPQRQTGMITAQQSQAPYSSQRGFTPSSGGSSAFRNLGAREQAILESFQALTQGPHGATPAEHTASYQQAYQQEAYYPQSHQQPQGRHQAAAYSSYEHLQRQQQAHADYSHGQASSQYQYQSQYYNNGDGHHQQGHQHGQR